MKNTHLLSLILGISVFGSNAVNFNEIFENMRKPSNAIMSFKTTEKHLPGWLKANLDRLDFDLKIALAQDTVTKPEVEDVINTLKLLQRELQKYSSHGIPTSIRTEVNTFLAELEAEAVRDHLNLRASDYDYDAEIDPRLYTMHYKHHNAPKGTSTVRYKYHKEPKKDYGYGDYEYNEMGYGYRR